MGMARDRAMRKFQIQCGKHFGIIKAPTLGEAWRKLTQGKTRGFAPLARFVEVGGRAMPWQYIAPQALDEMK